jgi:CYTH domain-containing protein
MEELELTFLAKELPSGLKRSPKKEMLDIYLPSTSKHPTLRVRKCGDRLEITKKEPIDKGDRSRQLETTIPLRKDEYRELALLKGKRVEKVRHYYKVGKTTYEVDVFKGALAGLIVVDVEFKTIAEKKKFKAPAWCGADVTQEHFIAGGMLCGKKYKDIEKSLARFGYKKLKI